MGKYVTVIAAVVEESIIIDVSHLIARGLELVNPDAHCHILKLEQLTC